MSKNIDIIVSIRADVVIYRLYPVTASLYTRITAGVLAATGYGIAIDAMPLGSDSVEAIELVHDF